MNYLTDLYKNEEICSYIILKSNKLNFTNSRLIFEVDYENWQ